MLLSGFVFTQTYKSSYEVMFPLYENYLNQFGIYYLGSQDRFLMVSGEIDSLIAQPNEQQYFDSLLLEVRQGYSEFIAWKPNDFKLLPDTNVIFTFGFYLSDKTLDWATEFAFGIVNVRDNLIVNHHRYEVNDTTLNIKSIDILEDWVKDENNKTNFFGSWVLSTNYEGVTEVFDFYHAVFGESSDE